MSIPAESIATMTDNYAHSDEDIVGRALKTDPLHAAEKVTGKSYKEDKATEALGFLMHMEHVEAKRKILSEAGDTHYSMSYADYVKVITRLGFEEQETRQFQYDRHRDTPVTLHACTYTHPLGAILTFTTYAWSGGREETINSANLYFNWRGNDKYRAAQEASWAAQEEARNIENKEECERAYEAAFALYPPHLPYSGHFVNSNPDIPDELPNPEYDESYEFGGENYGKVDYDHPKRTLRIPNPEFDRSQWVQVATIDGREGLAHHFGQLLEWGDFVTPWVEVPWGLNTFDLNESHAFYNREDRSNRFPMIQANIASWPQAMKDIVGEEALVAYVEHERDMAARGI